MLWPFDLDFMQRALIAGVAVGASAPLIGTFLVQRRLSLMGDGIGHIAFTGVGAGLALGVWPVWAALVVAVAGALGIEWLRRSGVAGDLVLALFFYAGIAGGAVIASAAGELNSVVAFLFGSILLTTWPDVWVIGGLAVTIVLTVLVAGRAMFAVLVDEEAARVAGLPVDALNAVLAVLVAVTVVVGMQVVGLLLVAALMVLPVATAQTAARSFRGTLIGSAVAGAGAVVVGLGIAREAPVAPGGTIVLVAAAAFAVVAGVSRRRAFVMPREPALPEER